MNHCLLDLTSLTPGFSGIGIFPATFAYAGPVVGIGVMALFLVLLSLYWVRHQAPDRLRDKRNGRTESSGIQTLESPKADVTDSEFIAAVGHEIRNPMNGIVGIVESINTDGLDPAARHKLSLLRHCADHLASLLEDFLGYSQAPADIFSFASEPFDVSALMESIIALSTAESNKRGIPVEIAISPAVPRQLTGDPRRIRQILLNYVYNALKYSSGGVVNVTVWRNGNSSEAAEIFFAVSDDGPGIPAKEQKDIFTRIDRNPIAQSAGSAGTQLGLFICKTLAEKMNGRVWLKSEAGKGSCFYFSALFPVPEYGKHASAFPPPPLPQNLHRALLIDDAEYNRVALAGMLETLGLNVQSTSDPEEFLSFAKSQDFDVIFIDYSVEGGDGPAMARQIRALSGASANATIFAVTAFNTAEKRAACLSAGMDAFLTKPITLERLGRALKASAAVEKSPESRPISGDPLANLRLLAARKGTSFNEELTLYFLEFETELGKLADALKNEDSGRANYFAHLLYGRCSFINERDLELTLRKIESITAMERWDEARKLGHDVQIRVESLRVKLVAGNPVAQRA